jgi:hypothetical protein
MSIKKIMINIIPALVLISSISSCGSAENSIDFDSLRIKDFSSYERIGIGAAKGTSSGKGLRKGRVLSNSTYNLPSSSSPFRLLGEDNASKIKELTLEKKSNSQEKEKQQVSIVGFDDLYSFYVLAVTYTNSSSQTYSCTGFIYGAQIDTNDSLYTDNHDNFSACSGQDNILVMSKATGNLFYLSKKMQQIVQTNQSGFYEGGKEVFAYDGGFYKFYHYTDGTYVSRITEDSANNQLVIEKLFEYPKNEVSKIDRYGNIYISNRNVYYGLDNKTHSSNDKLSFDPVNRLFYTNADNNYQYLNKEGNLQTYEGSFEDCGKITGLCYLIEKEADTSYYIDSNSIYAVKFKDEIAYSVSSFPLNINQTSSDPSSSSSSSFSNSSDIASSQIVLANGYIYFYQDNALYKCNYHNGEKKKINVEGFSVEGISDDNKGGIKINGIDSSTLESRSAYLDENDNVVYDEPYPEYEAFYLEAL